jgi:hypothetical protein
MGHGPLGDLVTLGHSAARTLPHRFWKLRQVLCGIVPEDKERRWLEALALIAAVLILVLFGYSLIDAFLLSWDRVVSPIV